MYNAARATYERLMRKDYGVHPLHMAHAMFERAKCITLAGDMNTGVNELRKFTADPLRRTPVAPQAVLQLATYLRTQNKPNEAVDLFVKNREFLESSLAKDQENGTTMIALLRYHHGFALREIGKLPEARAIIYEVGEPNLGLQFDIYHRQVEDGDVAVAMKEYAALTRHYQIANPPDRGEPDAGDLNYGWLLQQIDASGYKGWVGCEYKPRKTTVEGLGWAAACGVKLG